MAVVERMVAIRRSVPTDGPSMKTRQNPRGLAIHAMVLDVDVDYIAAAAELMDSVNFAAGRATRAADGIRLEMMNLTATATAMT